MDQNCNTQSVQVVHTVQQVSRRRINRAVANTLSSYMKELAFGAEKEKIILGFPSRAFLFMLLYLVSARQGNSSP